MTVITNLQVKARCQLSPRVSAFPETMTFYRATHATHASAVLAVVILPICPCVCLSVCLSVCHTRALWQNQTTHCRYSDTVIPHKRAITLVFWHQQWLVGEALFDLKFAIKMRDNQKVQLWRIGSRPRAIQRALAGVRTLPLSPPKGGSKSDFLFFNIKVNRIKSATKFLCENFQRQSCSVTIPKLVVHRYWCETKPST